MTETLCVGVGSSRRSLHSLKPNLTGWSATEVTNTSFEAIPGPI